MFSKPKPKTYLVGVTMYYGTKAALVTDVCISLENTAGSWQSAKDQWIVTLAKPNEPNYTSCMIRYIHTLDE